MIYKTINRFDGNLYKQLLISTCPCFGSIVLTVLTVSVTVKISAFMLLTVT